MSRPEEPIPRGVRCTRHGVVESVHLVHAVVCARDGQVVASHGDPDWVTVYRSAAKPFQAIPLVDDRVVEVFGLDQAELALTAASHNGEPEHVAGVVSILSKVGFSTDALRLGPLPPLRPEAAESIYRSGSRVEPIHNNCSGQHAAMLGLAQIHGWPTDTYLEPSHPLQDRMLQEMARFTGLGREDIRTMPDGCGMLAFGVPLKSMATSFARLGAWSREEEGPARILEAMSAHPFMVGGTDRLCTELVRGTGGRMVGKLGAEGVYGVAIPEEGLGIAVKVQDGGTRAGDAATLRVLDQMGLLGQDEGRSLERFRTSIVRNTLNEAVGEISADFVLEPRSRGVMTKTSVTETSR